ncbi:MAG: sporulation protein [Clostridiales bacterium]|nr:sporulation protein [Clostridiales bacterium]
MNEPTGKPYALTLERREKAVLTGVTEVERFDEKEVVLRTHGGRLTLTGTGLHVSSLQLEEGRLLVDGEIDGMLYDGGASPRRGFLRRALG